ncbi:MAG: caspase family protein [Anaerolineales bacterium]|nr:caspase family protein [Anaerolineales bacterium]
MAKYALCIGINNYPGTESDLAGCVNDARDWEAAFSERGFSVRRLTDRRATGKAMRAAIRGIVSGAESGDLIVVHYSGHGSFVPDEDGDEPDGTDECLCPYDVRAKGVITDDELFEMYGARKPGVRLVMISDSCNSGTVARFVRISTPPATGGKTPPRRRVRFLPPGAFLSKRQTQKFGIRRAIRRSSPPGRNGGLLLAGCQDAEYSYDAWFRGRPNGVFTFVALQALAALPQGATYQDWYAAIREVLPSQQYPQTPNLYGTKSMKRWQALV